jgi:polysaccharide pyruvyl transferase WcaK-like protein
MILIEHSDYWHINKGDLAMLDVTIERIRHRWPTASVAVMSEAPLLLQSYFPSVHPVQPWTRHDWRGAAVVGRVCGRVGPTVMGPIDMALLEAKRHVHRGARLARRTADLARASRGTDREDIEMRDEPAPSDRLAGEAPAGSPSPNIERAVRAASLVVALGGGYLADADPLQSRRALTLLQKAQTWGVHTALVGQGIGPAEDPALLAAFAEVLPHVDFVGLREGRRSPRLLEQAGVMPERMAVVGDDAIELSYRHFGDRPGSDIGVCLRIAAFAPVSRHAVADLRSVLQSSARTLGAHLRPVLISSYKSEDLRSTMSLLEGFDRTRAPLGSFVRPQQVAEVVSECRVMVTGAYHAAVFALAQGIPVVALSASLYYDDKFLGLRDMFGTGIEMVRLDDPDFPQRLTVALRSAWIGAEQVRAPLRERGRQQIAASRHALNRVLDLVEAPTPLGGAHGQSTAD